MKSAIYEEWTSGSIKEKDKENLARLQNVLTRLATQILGESKPHVGYIKSIEDQDRLAELIVAAPQANSWDELLGLS